MTLLALGEVYIYIYIHAIVSDSQPSLSLDSIWTLENQNNTYIITVFQLNLLCPTGYIFVIKLLQLSSLDLAMPYPTIRELKLNGASPIRPRQVLDLLVPPPRFFTCTRVRVWPWLIHTHHTCATYTWSWSSEISLWNLIKFRFK